MSNKNQLSTFTKLLAVAVFSLFAVLVISFIDFGIQFNWILSTTAIGGIVGFYFGFGKKKE